MELVLFRKFKDLTKKQKVLCVFQASVVGIVLGVVIGVLISKSYAVQNILCKVEYKLNPSADNLYYLCENLRNSNSDEYEKYYNELLEMEDLQIENYQANPTTENLFELCDFLNDIDSEKYPQYCHELVDREDFLDNISCSEFYYDGITDNISDNTKIKLYVRSMYLITCVYNYAEHNDVDGFVKEVSYINSKYYYYYNNRIIPDIYKMLEACDNNFALENKTAVIDALCDIIIEQSNNSKDSVNNSQFVKDELYFVLAYYRNNDCQGLKHPKVEMEEIYSDVVKDYSETYTDEHKQVLLERDNQIISEYKSYWENLLKTNQV